MRGIPGSGVFIFFVIGAIVELLAFFAVRQLIDHKKTKKKVTYLYWAVSIVLFGILAYAFINPDRIREASNYQFFYFVISVSFFNFLPKAFLAFMYLSSFVLRLFRLRFFARIWLLSGFILTLGIMLTIGYGITFGRKSLRVIKHEVYFPNLPKSLDKTTIVQVSDLHLGSFENDHFIKRCVRTINDIHPDLLLFTGDMVNNFAKEMQGFEGDLSAMHAKYGKFAILGNHDYGDYSKWPSNQKKQDDHLELEKQIEAAGFKLLLNQSVKVSFKDTAMEIIGVENWGHHPFPQYANLNKAMKGINNELFQVLMTHDPAHWEEKVISKTNIPLTLSGHTHGGQSGILFAGIEFSPMYFIQKCWGGLYWQDEQFLYVNRGIGCIGLLGRIEMDPEITLLVLRSK